MDKVTTYSITLADETVIENLTLNGNNFVSSDPIDPLVFVNNCSPIIISDGENTETHENAELVQVVNRNGKYYIVLRDITDQELRDRKIRSDIDYLAMMTDTDLEEG